MKIFVIDGFFKLCSFARGGYTSDWSKSRSASTIALGALASLGAGYYLYLCFYPHTAKPLRTSSSGSSAGSTRLSNNGEGIAGSGESPESNSTTIKTAEKTRTIPFVESGLGSKNESESTASARIDNGNTIDGVPERNQEFYLELIRLDSNNGNAYLNLAHLLNGDEGVTINGVMFRKRDLYLKAIGLNTEDGSAYRHVASLVLPSEEIVLEDGSKLNRRQLYCKAIACSESDAMAYYGVATLLAPDESIKLSDQVDAREFSQRDLYVCAIVYNPSFAEAYNNLGALLSPNETLKIGTDDYSDQMLFLKAINLRPEMASPYFHLAERLESVKSTIKLSGVSRGKKFLYTKVIVLDPGCVPAYCKLANILIEAGAKRWNVNDKIMTPEDLFKEAINRGLECYEAYHGLGKILEKGQLVSLLDGRKLTKQALFIETIRINPQFSEAYSELAATLENDDESIALADQRVLTRKQLLKLSIGDAI